MTKYQLCLNIDIRSFMSLVNKYDVCSYFAFMAKGIKRVMLHCLINLLFHRTDGVHHDVPAEELPHRGPSARGCPRLGEGLHRLHEEVDGDRDAG